MFRYALGIKDIIPRRTMLCSLYRPGLCQGFAVTLPDNSSPFAGWGGGVITAILVLGLERVP